MRCFCKKCGEFRDELVWEMRWNAAEYFFAAITAFTKIHPETSTRVLFAFRNSVPLVFEALSIMHDYTNGTNFSPYCSYIIQNVFLFLCINFCSFFLHDIIDFNFKFR